MQLKLQSSFASLAAKDVLAACDGYLDARAKRISEKREALIGSMMSRRIFRPMNRDAARQRLVAEGASGEYQMTAARGGYWADRIKDLRRLALAAGDGEVFVCAEDAGALANFLPPNVKVSSGAEAPAKTTAGSPSAAP